MPLKGPLLLEGPGRKPPPDARQGYPSCVVPAVRNGPPPCPDPKSASGKLSSPSSPKHSMKNGSSGGPHHHHHHHKNNRQYLPLPDIQKHHPVLGGPQPHLDEPLLPARMLACCACGILVAGVLLYMLYEYVRQETELRTPHVDVGNVEFVNAVFAHRVADIIRTAASEAATLPSYSGRVLGWSGLGVTGPPLAGVLGTGLKLLREQGPWEGEGGSRREMAVVDGGDNGGAAAAAAGIHAGRLKSSSSLSSSSSSSFAKSASSLSSSISSSLGRSARAVGAGGFKEMCGLYPDKLLGNVSGDVDREHQTLTLSQVQAWHADLRPGGEWSPANCVARYRLAVIIPYRDRLAHLTVLLAHLLPILKRQQLHFKVFVVEQHGNLTFNKGRIMNAAFKEALKMYDFQCVVFHDVDLIPEDDRNMYSCPVMPRHMSVAINEMNYKLSYNMLVGGVLNMRVEHYQHVNGYSNMYWGWGAEDDDMAYRILHVGLKIFRPPVNIARYQMIKHTKRKPSSWSIRSRLLRTAVKRYHLDGLNSVQYSVNFIHADPLYTHIMVDIGKPDMRIER